MFLRAGLLGLTILAAATLGLQAGTETVTVVPPKIIISVTDQTLLVIDDGKRAAV